MAEWIGFTVDQNDSLSPAQIQEIVQWCAGPKLILELSDNSNADTVLSHIHTLPVDGLELTLNQWAEFQNIPEIQGFDLIFTDALPDNGLKSNSYSHNSQFLASQSHITRLINPPQLKDNIELTPFAISLTCTDSENPALKNYDVWVDFLESLEMI